MTKWNQASFCKACDQELDEWDLIMKDYCPYCATRSTSHMIEHYDRLYYLEEVSSRLFGLFKKYKRVYEDEVEETDAADNIAQGVK
jgi:predicted amidophosphoribosyltransferase